MLVQGEKYRGLRWVILHFFKAVDQEQTAEPSRTPHKEVYLNYRFFNLDKYRISKTWTSVIVREHALNPICKVMRDSLQDRKVKWTLLQCWCMLHHKGNNFLVFSCHHKFVAWQFSYTGWCVKSRTYMFYVDRAIGKFRKQLTAVIEVKCGLVERYEMFMCSIWPHFTVISFHNCPIAQST